MSSPSNELVVLAKDLEDRKVQHRNLEQALKDKEAQIKNLQEQRRLLEHLQVVNAMTVRKMENADPQRANRAQVSQESIDRIVQLDNLVKHEIAQREALEVSRETLQGVLQGKDKRLAQLQTQLRDLKTMTAWDSRSIKSKDDYVDLENKVVELKKALSRLQDEQEAVRQVTTVKTGVVEKLVKQLEDFKDVEAQLFQAQTAHKLKERELEDAREDLRTLDRIAIKKERILGNIKADDEVKGLRHLETQKKILHHDIHKLLEARRGNDRTILAQQSRIEMLEEKLRIASVVVRQSKGGNALTPEERATYLPGVAIEQDSVDAASFELVQKELNDMHSTLTEREGQLLELDAAIESVERKVNILAKAKAANSKRHILDRRDQTIEAAQLEAYIAVRNESYQQQLEQLETENTKLGSLLRRIQN